MSFIRDVTSRLKSAVFRTAEKYLGIHITPVHFYSPVPTLREIDPAASASIHECPGLDFQVDAQLRALRETFPRYTAEYTPLANSGLARVDAFALYALLRAHKPRVVVEVGAGESTKVILAALQRNHADGVSGRLTSIDPYPQPYLAALAAPGFQVLASKVQEVPDSVFADADVLFIDSSHVTKFGSDVNHEILRLVPRVKVGALVHWHDIMIPQDYPMSWLNKGTFWNESYMVHAFMLFNDAFKTRWAARSMQVTHAGELQRSFPYFAPGDPSEQLSSFWVERVR